MNNNETVKKQENKTVKLEKLMESIIIEEVDSDGIENLSSIESPVKFESPDNAAELISKIEHVIKSKKNKQYFSIGLSPRYNF